MRMKSNHRPYDFIQKMCSLHGVNTTCMSHDTPWDIVSLDKKIFPE